MSTVHADDKLFARKALNLWLATKDQLNEALRIVGVRAQAGEVASVEQVLFERGALSGEDVAFVQRQLRQRTVFCPACGERQNAFEAQGARMPCAYCSGKIAVPGHDERNPFLVREEPRVQPATDPRALQVFGALGAVGAGALLVDVAVESRASHLALPAAACAAAFALAAVVARRKLPALTWAALGVAVLTALAVVAGLGSAPGSRALVALGHDGHLVLAPLALLHLLAVFFTGHEAVMRARSMAPMLALAPVLWGLVFFTVRSVPGTDPALWVAGGPSVLAALPWYLHPGALTLWLVFPVAAVACLGGAARALVAAQPALALRRVVVAASLSLLTGFGLAVGASRGHLPHAGVQARIRTALAGHVSPWWSERGERAPQRAETVAVALSATGSR